MQFAKSRISITNLLDFFDTPDHNIMVIADNDVDVSIRKLV